MYARNFAASPLACSARRTARRRLGHALDQWRLTDERSRTRTRWLGQVIADLVEHAALGDVAIVTIKFIDAQNGGAARELLPRSAAMTPARPTDACRVSFVS